MRARPPQRAAALNETNMQQNTPRNPALLSVVAPVFNEQELIEEFVTRVLAAVGSLRSSWCW